MLNQEFYIDVLLPIKLRQSFTYAVTSEQAAMLQIGMRVTVPFGKSKIYTGIVLRVHQQKPTYKTKQIDQILDEDSIITLLQLKHWQWIATYYMCTFGEVLRAALPKAFLLESETVVFLSAKKYDEKTLSDDAYLIFEALQHHTKLHIQDIRAILNKKNVFKTLQQLINKNVIEVEEKVYEKYTPKLKRYIKLAAQYTSEHALKNLLDQLSTRATKQKEVLMTLFLMQAQSHKPIASLDLQKKANVTASVLKTLLDKGILEEYFIKKDRIAFEGDTHAVKTLSKPQQTALNQIKDSFKTHNTTLLFGVTSSGKTEVYVQLIKETLAKGQQVLYMLPEIALTTQLIERLKHYFGNQLSVYHSKYSLNERVEVWNNIKNNNTKAQLVVGVRSSLFLPFSNLGLLIVDEEHEPSYKQYDPAPRYHARDSAIVLANLHKAKVLLGSATPAIETYFNAKEGKYGFVHLKERFGKVLLPDIELIDIKEKSRKKQMKGHFSDSLLEAIHQALADNHQVLLFQNRRGYAPVVSCTTCGVSPQCTQCDVSLTYHKFKNELRCHYCGYHKPMPVSCEACGNTTLDTKGLGTEQIEAELHTLFPNKTIARMDQDTMRGKNAYAKLIDALDNQEIDILVGTQMLAKGLDFRNINLVGVLNADNLLNFPDFRAHERSFQLLQQVAGRAGRTKKRGKVLIQTYNPFHQILQQVSSYKYEEMFEEQLHHRYQFKYPPYYRLIKITCKDKNYNKVQKAALWYSQALKNNIPEIIVLGPESPPVGKIRNYHIMAVLLKIPKNKHLNHIKNAIGIIEKSFDAIKDFSSVKVSIDVDYY
jgi:primosomal protein N' (replication factor Y)